MANLQTGSLLGYLHGIASREASEHASDRELLQRFANHGDEAAFAALVKRHGAMVLHVAQRILHQKQDAEDVFQAAFLVLARKAGSIVWRDSIANWLYQVAFRLAHEARINASRRQAVEARANSLKAAVDPLADISLRETLVIFEEELSKLPGSLRMPVVLCLLEGEGQAKSAHRLGWSLATLKRRLTRGRQVLHARLARRGLHLAAALAAGEVAKGTSRGAASAALVGVSIQAAVTFQGGQVLANAAGSRAVTLAQSLLKRLLFARLALAGCIATVCCVSVGMGIIWYQGTGGTKSATTDSETLPIRGTLQAAVTPSEDLPTGAVARLGTLHLREGFPGVIRLTPDGKIFLSLDASRTLRTFDTESGKIVSQRQLPPLKESRDLQAAFSRNLSRLVVRTEIGFDVWDLTKHLRLRTLTMKAHTAFRTALAPDDRIFAALEYSGGNGTLRLWDIESGESRVIGDHLGIIQGVAFSPDGQLVVTNDGKGTHCWQVVSGKSLWHNRDQLTDKPTFLPDGNSFLGAVYFPSPGVKRWDTHTGKQLDPGKLPKLEHYSGLMISPDGRTAAFLIQNNGLLFWDLQTGGSGAHIQNATSCAAFSPDGKTVLGAIGTSLARWEVATGRALYPDTMELGHFGGVHGLEFAHNGGRLISSSSHDGTMRAWDVASRKPVLRVNEAKIRLGMLAVSPGGHLVAGAAEGLNDYGLIRVWDAATGQAVHVLSARSPSIPNERVLLSALRFSPDGKQLTAFGAVDDDARGPVQSVVVTFDLASGRQVYRRTGTPAEAAKCATSDGKRFLSLDGRLFISDSGKQIQDIKTTFSGSFDSCAFSADQSLLAGTISEHFEEGLRGGIRPKGFRIWEMASGKVVAEFAITGWLGHLVFTPDARYLIGTDASAIRVFDILQGREILHFDNSRRVHDADNLDLFAGALCVSPDGRTLASGHADSTILLWNLPQPAKRGSKPLTSTETKQTWTALAEIDAPRARRAMNDLALSPVQTVAFLKAQLKPVTDTQSEKINALIVELDAEEFTKREAAHRALIQLNGLAEPEIQEVLKRSPSEEARRRLNQILLNSPTTVPPAELQSIRAVQILEHIATPEAKQLLRSLAGGVPAASLTRLAKESLERLSP